MEDDDEFGDLYADVLRPVSAVPLPPIPLSSASAPAPAPAPAPASALAPNPQSVPLLGSDDDDDDDDGDRILYGARAQTLPPPPEDDTEDDWLLGHGPAAMERPENWDEDDDEAASRPSVVPESPTVGEPRVLEDELEEEARASDGGADVAAAAEGVRFPEDGDDRLLGGRALEKMEIGDPYLEPAIPGLSSGSLAPGPSQAVACGDVKASGSEDWDSDSEDDLQIVLNDSNPVLLGGEMIDDDEDGEEDLVIVADQPHHQQTMDEQDWGEEAMQPAADGERKEMLEAGKANGAVGTAASARAGYSNHGFHAQHHSMYKYIRPGAGPVPGGPLIGTVGGPGQIRPASTLGPIAGRGRGDWRPGGVRGISNGPRGFSSGYGLQGWANNSSGRPFGSGLDFTLPSYKTVFDIDIESFDEKPWRHPGVDISEFFNFGLDEDNWKDYCKQLEQFRLESTMQSRIRVYESGRSELEYDPDLPPELAAAAGHHDCPADNGPHSKADNGQANLNSHGREALCIQTPFPIGRAIQVEGGYGERLPSMDTRPPRMRDSDAIIEIALQGSLDDSTPYDGALSQPEKDLQGEDLRDVVDFEEDDRHVESESFDRFPHTSSGRKREMVTRKAPFAPDGDGILPFHSGPPLMYHLNTRLQSAVKLGGPSGTHYGGRFRQGTSRGRHSNMNSERLFDARGAQVNRHNRHQIENQGDSMEGNQISEAVETAVEPSVEKRESEHDDRLALGDSIDVGDEMVSDFHETPGDDCTIYSAKKQKLSSRVEQPVHQDNGDDDDMRTTHSDNGRAKSASSKDYQKRREGGEEVLQDGRSTQVGVSRKHHEEEDRNSRRKDGREVRHEINHVAPRGREDLYRSYPHTVRGRSEVFERPKEMDGSTGGRRRREDDIHTRRVKEEDTRKEQRHEEMASRNKNKRVDDGDWRGRHREGDTRPGDRDDVLTRRRENLDDPPLTRRKEEHSRREKVDKPKEDSNKRKRERDDGANHKRREEVVKMRDKAEDHHSAKHKDDSWRQREREDKQRLKQPHEGLPVHRERDGGRGAVRNGRAAEGNPLPGNGKSKDDSKGNGSNKDSRHQDRRGQRVDRSGEGNNSQHKGREDVYAREKQSNNDERSSRHERLNSHGDRPSNASDREKYRENTRKSKDIEISGPNLQGSTKRKHEDHNTHRNEKVRLKGSSEQESSRTLSKKGHHPNNEQPEDPQVRPSSEKLGEGDLASDDDNQRGRSKLERWTSHKERDYSTIEDALSLVKELEGADTEMVQADESAKTEGIDANDPDPKDVDAGLIADKTGDDRDRHLDTVAKLKRRSERFKLPMPGEKETGVNKKAENEVQLTQNEAAANTEIKPERPARKRRWTGS